MGSFWVTDVDVNNAGDTEMTYQFQYIARGEAKASEVSSIYTLGPGMSMRFGNVLQRAFGLSQGLGALVMMADTAEALIISRTYNLTDNGTYGQSIPGNLTSDPTTVLPQ